MMATINNKMQPARLGIYIALALVNTTHAVNARDVFNAELVELDNPGAGKADLSAFEMGSQAPGKYHVDIILDDQLMETTDIEFTSAKGEDEAGSLQPCLSVAQLKKWGVKTALFPDLARGDPPCANLQAIPQASTEFQFGAQRLLIGIPQAAIDLPARGYVSPELWDEGIAAAMLNYSLSGANAWSKGGQAATSDSRYANLRPGINIGPWRLRNYTTWSRDDAGQNAWDTVYTYAQRAVIPLKAQLTLGDSSAPADVFDSMPFRGGQLASDDDMLPDSLKGYAPVVRGIARTNAQVVVRQNGYQIYQTYVAPGAFEITDMYPTGGAGDLDVTVKEADGSEQRFTIPYASLPVLQREGRVKYAFTGGQYRSYNHRVEKTPFGQIAGIYGLPYGITLYGGLQGSSKYQSIAMGVGKNMGGLGALSTDVTQGWSTPQGVEKSSGQSWRARYSKNVVETGTHFAIAGYRYFTSGYYGMQEVLDSYGDSSALQDRRRNRAELTMSQALGSGFGSLTLSAAREDYWNSGRSMSSYSLGYNNYWRNISYGLTWTYGKNASAGSHDSQKRYDEDRLLAFTVSIPLDRFLPQTWANYGMNASKNNGTTHNVGLNGVALANNALSWNIQQGYGTNSAGDTGNINGTYKGKYGEMTAGYGYDRNSERLNYGFQGGIVAHSEGVTLAQPLGETNVLINTRGAPDVGVTNMTGVTTDYRGYAVGQNLMPYRKNDVSLMTETVPTHVELNQTIKTVIPTRGAIVRADYKTSMGIRMLITLTQQNGKRVPFGAIANATGVNNSESIVGDNGQVYLTGLDPNVEVSVQWKDKTEQTCRVRYLVSKEEQQQDIVLTNLQCR